MKTITPYKTIAEGPYRIELIDFADTWTLDTPAPDNWHELVYRVFLNGNHLTNEQIPAHVANIGDEMVREWNQWRTDQNKNAWIEIREWMSAP
jgi:hypothetical protein